jgi:hypothetical protein
MFSHVNTSSLLSYLLRMGSSCAVLLLLLLDAFITVNSMVPYSIHEDITMRSSSTTNSSCC